MNIFELFGTIAIKNKDANKSIDETGGKATKLASIFGQIGQEATRVGKVVAKGMAVIGAAGTAAVSLLMKNSIGQFAEYEQLVGGVETLFGAGGKSLEEYAESVGKSVEEASGEYDKLIASQNAVLENSKNAYKTAGLSANEYMATATSFAASLLQGLGGDTQAAATMTDMAIQDMADNANKMGTDISMIQNAYQGFAKQNFTMLDNLKLGYGGTQTEMARLINDSGVMGETMVVTAENLNEVSFAKMIEAIHVIQKEMGITGATAEEAEKTITGSFNAWKSAGSNLLRSIASGDEKSMAEATEAFTAQTKVLLTNLQPVVSNVLNSIGTLMTELLPEIGEQAIDFGSAIIANIVNGITGSSITSEDVKNAINSILDIGGTALDNTLSFVNDALAWITENKELVITAIAAIAAAFLWFKITTNPIGAAVDAIAAGLLLLVTNWESVKSAITTALEKTLEFFGVDPEAFYQLLADLQEAWNTYVVAPIQTAINKVNEFLGLDSEKTITVTYKTQVAGAAESAGDAVTEATGSSFWGDLAQMFVQNSTQNPDNLWQLPGFASGLNYVPKDNFVARLHIGEAVLPRNEAELWRSGKGEGSVDTSKLESIMGTVATLLQQVVTNTAAGHSISLDGGALVGQLAPRLDAQLGIMTARKERRG